MRWMGLDIASDGAIGIYTGFGRTRPGAEKRARRGF
jgi:hypothetical protein